MYERKFYERNEKKRFNYKQSMRKALLAFT